MARVNLTVAITEDCLDDILEVAQKLRAAGMDVAQILDTVGVITGSTESTNIKLLSNVAGVESVEAARSIQFNPPGSSIQ